MPDAEFSNNFMNESTQLTARKDAISKAAYYYWLKAGKPAGRDQEFWIQAEKDMTAAEAAQKKAATTAVPTKPAAPAPVAAKPATFVAPVATKPAAPAPVAAKPVTPPAVAVKPAAPAVPAPAKPVTPIVAAAKPAAPAPAVKPLAGKRRKKSA